MRFHPRSPALALVGCLALGACARPPAAQPAASLVTPVSMSNLSAEAAEVVRLCGVRQYLSQVAGMGQVPHARDLPNYVNLTGREPEVQGDEPIWAVAFTGQIALTTRSRAGTAMATNPTCVVVGDVAAGNGIPEWMMTGPVTDAMGTRTPEPRAAPAQSLPPLQP